MHLDLLTLVAMGSFVAACAGVVLLVAWWQNRKTLALLLWGLANIVTASGIASLMLASALQQPAWWRLGGSLLALAPGLMWKAARSFDAKPAPLVFAFLGAVVVGLASSVAGTRAVGESLSLAFAVAYLIAAGTAFWLGRKERLRARWPIIVLTIVHAAVLLIGLFSNLVGALGPGEIPAVKSLFGFIHFESIVFTLGTAVFILALIKERNEAASERTARTDPLTGIANRAAFMEDAARLVERCRSENAPVSVIMCDLDGFKSINDTHGHAIGDAVIRKFCEIATDALWPNDIFGRIGGRGIRDDIAASEYRGGLCPRRADPRRFRGKLLFHRGSSGQCDGELWAVGKWERRGYIERTTQARGFCTLPRQSRWAESRETRRPS
jgi:hypothetical protein